MRCCFLLHLPVYFFGPKPDHYCKAMGSMESINYCRGYCPFNVVGISDDRNQGILPFPGHHCGLSWVSPRLTCPTSPAKFPAPPGPRPTPPGPGPAPETRQKRLKFIGDRAKLSDLHPNTISGVPGAISSNAGVVLCTTRLAQRLITVVSGLALEDIMSHDHWGTGANSHSCIMYDPRSSSLTRQTVATFWPFLLPLPPST